MSFVIKNDSIRQRLKAKRVSLVFQPRVGIASHLCALPRWPFTQHATLAPGGVTVVDARCGEHLAALRPEGGGTLGRDGGVPGTSAPPALDALYDGCASWWTQARPSMSDRVGSGWVYLVLQPAV